jgi:flagellar hook protein FlgE
MGFQQGLSGLNAASRNLDVIGNNIANANTVGMKTSRAEFAELYAASVGGSSGTGLGVTVEKVTQQFTQGNISVTGNNLDVAINGGGFFQLQQPDDTIAYTRAGNFKLDGVGNLVTNGGAKVMGNMIVGGEKRINEPLSFRPANIRAQATGNVEATFNLPAKEPEAAIQSPPTPRSTYGTSVNVYDSQGLPRPVNLYFVKMDVPNTWNVYTSLDETVQASTDPDTTLEFDANGEILSGGLFTRNVLTDPANPNSPEPLDIPISFDLSKATQFGSRFGVTDLQQDGYADGTLTSLNISEDGKVMVSYSNGVTRAEAEIVLTSFRNPQGLVPGAGNLWIATKEAGAPTSNPPGKGNSGMLRAGALEDSNVDLTSELVNMMVAQRAYQANAQTIKTQDQALSTLLNMR